MKVRHVLVACAVVLAAHTLVAQQALQSGLDRSTFDTAVRPQDDLFRHVNGAWLARTHRRIEDPVAPPGPHDRDPAGTSSRGRAGLVGSSPGG